MIYLLRVAKITASKKVHLWRLFMWCGLELPSIYWKMWCHRCLQCRKRKYLQESEPFTPQALKLSYMAMFVFTISTRFLGETLRHGHKWPMGPYLTYGQLQVLSSFSKVNKMCSYVCSNDYFYYIGISDVCLWCLWSIIDSRSVRILLITLRHTCLHFFRNRKHI